MSLTDEIILQIKQIQDLTLEIQKDLSKSSTFKLLAVGDFISVRSKEALIKLIHVFNSHQVRYRMLGLGANQILPKTSPVPYLKLNLPFDKNILNQVQEKYKVSASLSINVLTAHAIKFGLKGWEVFTGIPATVGGAIFMNAGTALGEFGKIVHSVEIVRKDGQVENYIVNEKSFSYRKNNFLNEGDIIVGAELKHFGIDESIGKKIEEYLQYRSDTQPLWAKTCGCMFKNAKIKQSLTNTLITCPAGKYIDIIGLTGLEYNGVKISRVHGNFFENNGEATYEDVIKLMEVVEKELFRNFGIKFESEVEY